MPPCWGGDKSWEIKENLSFDNPIAVIPNDINGIIHHQLLSILSFVCLFVQNVVHLPWYYLEHHRLSVEVLVVPGGCQTNGYGPKFRAHLFPSTFALYLQPANHKILSHRHLDGGALLTFKTLPRLKQTQKSGPCFKLGQQTRLLPYQAPQLHV